MTSTTKKRLLNYVRWCLEVFERDPVANEFQRGYKIAFEEMLVAINEHPDDLPVIPPSTAQACLTGAPHWARHTWYDANFLYLEFPIAEAAPYIMKFSFSEGGLTDALHTMKRLYQDCDVQAKEMYRKPSGGYTIKRTRKDHVAVAGATPEQASAVRDILRKGGYIK